MALVSWDGAGPVTCSDAKSNTYSVAVTDYDSTMNQTTVLCVATNVAAGPNTMSVTFDGPHGSRRLIVNEYSGVATANAIDVTAHRRGLSTTAVNNVTSGAATTTTAGDLVVGGVEDNTNQIVISAGTGFTQRNSLDNTDSAIQDKVQTVAGSVASTQTFSEANNSYSAVMVALKPKGSGGPPVGPRGALVFRLTWNTGADMDLYVTEPNGNLIYQGNAGPFPDTGRFDGDAQGACATAGATSGAETTTWTAAPAAGTYVVGVVQNALCSSISPRWTIEVFKNGTVVSTSTGTGNTTSDIAYTYAGA